MVQRRKERVKGKGAAEVGHVREIQCCRIRAEEGISKRE